VNYSCKKKIFIYGASGHAKVVIDIVKKLGLYDIEFLVDDNIALKGQSFFGYHVIGLKEDLLSAPEKSLAGLVAIGSNKARKTVFNWLQGNGYELISAIHPSTQLGQESTVGCGTVVMANATINSGSKVGDNVIINTNASVDHDCQIGNNVHIAPGATLCGGVSIGDGSFIAAGATIIPNLVIGENVTVGAGSVVLKNIPDNVTAVGNPARIL